MGLWHQTQYLLCLFSELPQNTCLPKSSNLLIKKSSWPFYSVILSLSWMFCRFSSKSFSNVADLSRMPDTLRSFSTARSNSIRVSDLYFLIGTLGSVWSSSSEAHCTVFFCRLLGSVFPSLSTLRGVVGALFAFLLLVVLDRPRIILKPRHFTPATERNVYQLNLMTNVKYSNIPRSQSYICTAKHHWLSKQLSN